MSEETEETQETQEIKKALEDGFRAAEIKAAKTAALVEQQLKAQNDANNELKKELDKAAAELKTASNRLTELEQKGVVPISIDKPALSLGQSFINAPEFKSLTNNQRSEAAVEIKNTLLSGPDTVLPQIDTRLRTGADIPQTVYHSLPHAPASSNSIQGLRETGFTNSAAEVIEGELKPESSLNFAPWDLHIRTIAHWIKVSKNLLNDAPAVAAYVDNRLRHGVLERIDQQLIQGDGNNPNISGILNPSNFTPYNPHTGDSLIDAINRAKYQLWSAGWLPDKVYVNPMDWSAVEMAKGSDGHYLYGLPGTLAKTNLFNVQIISCPWVKQGWFAIGAFNRAATIWNKETVGVEAGYVDNDFTKNLITLRAEARLALEISTPSAILGGEFTK